MVLDSSVRSASVAPSRSPQAAGGSSVCRCRQIVSRAAGASPLPGRTLSGGLGRPFVARRISAISAVLAPFVLACGALLSGPPAYGQSAEPTLNVAVANTPVAEGSVIEFVVSLSAAPAGTVTVDYGFHLYGATAGRDYTATPGTLTFEAPESRKTISVQTLQDDLLEENERVVITLADARGARIGTATATAVIQTDTSTPWLQIGDKWQCEKQATFGFRLPVRRGGERTSEVTVDYTTVDGTAKAGQDYTAQSGTLTFPANGTTIRLVTVEYLDDAATEGNETFRLQLSSPLPGGTGFILGRSSAVATITDNDGGYDCRFHDSGGGGDGAGTDGDGGDDGSPPGAPRDLSANPGNPRVTLSWAPGSDNGSPITGYDLRMSSDGGQTWSRWRPLAGSDADTVSHTVTGLTNGITYSFQLRARNAHGPGAPASVSAIPATTPGAPRDLSANASNPRVTLSWTPGPDGGSHITGYELRLSSDDDRTWSRWQPIPGSDARTTSHTVTGLTNGTTYSFQLRARNAQGAGAVASVDATPATTPGAPRGLFADAADGLVTLSWSTGPDGGSAITGYEVRHSSNGGRTWLPSWQPVTGSDARTTSHTVTGLTNGTTYSFQLRARNARGPGVAASVSATPATTPGAPRDLSAVRGDREVKLSWRTGPDGGSAITGYEIRHSSDGGRTSSWRPIADSDARTVSHLVTDLRNGITYSFQVRARNARGAGAAASVSATPATSASAWLPRFGRAAAAQVVDAVGTRVLGQAESESQVTLAGNPLAQAHDGAAPWARRADSATVGVVDFDALLAGSSFTLAAAGNERPGAVPHWTAWGRGAATRFGGEEQDVTVAGTVLSGTAGVDYEAGSFLGGLSVSYSDGSGGYTLRADDDRDVTSWLLSAHPYLRYRLGPVSLWGMVGYGFGMLALPDDELETELSILMGALGASAELLMPVHASGFGLAARGDALIVHTAAAPADGLVTEDADVTRLRLLLEGSYRGAALGGLAPALEVGVRHDGGAADEGLGLVLGGGLRYAYPPWGMELAANAQWLPLHEQPGFAQWGAVGRLAIAPGPPGHGPALSLNSSWGAVPSGAAQDLWTAPDPLATPDPADPGGQFAAELRYGVSWRGSRTVLTPYAGIALSARGDRIWRLGTRIQLEPSVHLTLEGSLNESSAGIGQEPAVALRASLR